MLPRILRVVRAKAVRKTALASQAARSDSKSRNANKERIYNPKLSSEAASLQGRASKLLGRAGAAQLKKKEGSGANMTELGKRGQGQKTGVEGGSKIEGIAKTPESIVFEGYRASAKAGKPRLKIGKGGGKNKGKPKTRSSKRASDWKKSGGKK
jgi:nucleolar protein 12